MNIEIKNNEGLVRFDSLNQGDLFYGISGTRGIYLKTNLDIFSQKFNCVILNDSYLAFTKPDELVKPIKSHKLIIE